MIYIDALMCLVMIAAALMTFFSRNLISAVIFSGAVSLVAAYLFLRMGAPDVAMTEAAIGSGLTTVIFLITIRRTQEVEA